MKGAKDRWIERNRKTMLKWKKGGIEEAETGRRMHIDQVFFHSSLYYSPRTP